MMWKGQLRIQGTVTKRPEQRKIRPNKNRRHGREMGDEMIVEDKKERKFVCFVFSDFFRHLANCVHQSENRNAREGKS